LKYNSRAYGYWREQQLTMNKILVTGALGQIGSELTEALRKRYGAGNVVATDIRSSANSSLGPGPFELLDVTNKDQIEAVVDQYKIDTIYHMAAILSINGEKNPQLAWQVNINGLHNILETARQKSLSQVFVPSSIAVFGPETPHDCAPQAPPLRPTTIYGITKVAGELLGEYYVNRFNLDVRGLRYPGIISSNTPPGGGTTDYAVEMFYQAIERGYYTCYVRQDTVLPMMYMPDCIRATMELMETEYENLIHHCDFNLSGMSFSAGQLAAEIAKHVPGFNCQYKPDDRQKVADSWPRSIDDSAARQEWHWKPSYDLETMTIDMIDRLSKKLQQPRPKQNTELRFLH
jgi:nucleoside-diphosphate-sugar epimerase